MNCPHCGTETRAGAQYCIRCGTPLAHSAEATTRPVRASLPVPPPPPPPAVPVRSTSRSRENRWLVLLAIGILIVACLAFACTLGACITWSFADGGSVAWAQPSPTLHVSPSHTPAVPTIAPTIPASTATPGIPTRSPIPDPTVTPGMPTQPPEGRTVGLTAPDFTLQDLDNRSITLSTLRGTNVVLIDFWATWCGPCKEELPHIQEMYDRYRDRGFTALVINVRESASLAGGFIANQGYTFPVLLDRDGEVLQRYGVRGIPSAFVVDTQGVIRKVQVGYRTGAETELAHAIESLLP